MGPYPVLSVFHYLMAPKLKNKPWRREDVEQYAAKEAAKVALKKWYSIGFDIANAKLPRIQVDSNLKVVAQIPGWQANKGSKNGYIMLTTLVNGDITPMIVVLNYAEKASGGLTGRSLHQQVRATLNLEPKVFLRMVPFRPWYHYMQKDLPVPEKRALPANDVQCTRLLGTTVLYYTYG